MVFNNFAAKTPVCEVVNIVCGDNIDAIHIIIYTVNDVYAATIMGLHVIRTCFAVEASRSEQKLSNYLQIPCHTHNISI